MGRLRRGAPRTPGGPRTRCPPRLTVPTPCSSKTPWSSTATSRSSADREPTSDGPRSPRPRPLSARRDTASCGSKRRAPSTAAMCSSTTAPPGSASAAARTPKASRSWPPIFEPFGVDVVSVPLTKALHLKSAVTALPDGTVVGFEPVVDDPGVWGERFLGVPEEPGLTRRAAGRRQTADVVGRTAHGATLRRARLPGDRCRHLRVREARGLCDLPVGPSARQADA